MNINFLNVEELIFSNKKIRDAFPELRHHFDSWMLSKRIAGLDHLRRRSLIDMLASLENFKEKLIEFFGTEIHIQRLDTALVKNLEISIEENIFLEGNFQDFTITRVGDRIGMTAWR